MRQGIGVLFPISNASHDFVGQAGQEVHRRLAVHMRGVVRAQVVVSDVCVDHLWCCGIQSFPLPTFILPRGSAFLTFNCPTPSQSRCLKITVETPERSVIGCHRDSWESPLRNNAYSDWR